MSKLEIKKLFTLPNGIHLPCGLNIKEKLWWRFMPGVIINVKWPQGWAILHDDGEGGQTSVMSADPNDHYRPWMEANVGQQGWDWNWGMANNDVSDNRLTIKIRQRHQDCAIIAKIMWS
jgi:hypothetical protein